MSLFLGLDSSTQSLSACVIDAEGGEFVAEEHVHFGSDLPHYGLESGFAAGTEDGEIFSNPLMWLEAVDLLFARLVTKNVPLEKVVAVSGCGQQHGSVFLNSQFESSLDQLSAGSSLVAQLGGVFSRPVSPIWMDSSTSSQCEEITQSLGGAEEVCRRSGSVAIERFTGPQIRKFAQQDPTAYRETTTIHLVSSFLASVLSGRSVAIDTGDGAGMNLMNLTNGSWDGELLTATAPDLGAKLPPVSPSATITGKVAPYFAEKYGLNTNCQVVLWSGDNPGSLVGMGAAQPGKVVISLGTSDTLFAAMPQPVTDPRGFGHVFGNPMGGFMSLICFRNGSLAREAIKEQFGLSWQDFELTGLARTEPANGQRVMLPFVADEITPRVSSSAMIPCGWEGQPSAAECVRGVLEGQFLNMKYHADWLGVETEEILLTGGASENDGIAQTAADIFGKKVRRLEISGSAALGAALRAAVAVGDSDLARLEEVFSAPTPGRDLLPRPEYTSRYQDLEKVFAEALRKHFAVQ